MMALLPVVDRYGAAIEWDLRERWQVDIHEYFRGERPWAQLRRFLEGLPPTSHYIIAKRNDPVVALDVARRERERSAEGGVTVRYRPPALEWDTHAELLAALIDRLGEAVALLADLPILGKKRRHKPPKRMPRPESGVERAERQLSLEHALEIVADVEAGYVTEEEYARIAADVEEQRRQAAATAQAVTSGQEQRPGD